MTKQNSEALKALEYMDEVFRNSNPDSRYLANGMAVNIGNTIREALSERGAGEMIALKDWEKSQGLDPIDPEAMNSACSLFPCGIDGVSVEHWFRDHSKTAIEMMLRYKALTSIPTEAIGAAMKGNEE